MEAAWRDAGGHALTLQLLGRFIVDAYEDKDIRHYREVKFEQADLERQGRSAFKVMIAYERWLQSAAPSDSAELALLRLTGLFDRPMSRECLEVLRAEPAIAGLTDALVKLDDRQWNIALKRLGEVDLLTVTRDSIDAHPLIREYFASQLRDTQPDAFRSAHAGCSITCARRRSTGLIRSRAFSRSTRPSSTAASPDDSGRRSKRYTATASSAVRGAVAITASSTLGRSGPISRRWRRSSTSPGAASHRISELWTRPGC